MVFPVNVTHSRRGRFDPLHLALTLVQLLLEGQGGQTCSNQIFFSLRKYITSANTFYPKCLSFAK